jgi:hypothetical protein
MAGTACAGTRETINFCKCAESLGYDGAQIVLPFYFTPPENGMYQHYKKICEAVGPHFGIQIYNNPHVAGCWVKPHLMKRISKIPQMILGQKPLPGVLVVDRYAGYNKAPCSIQYCYAHLLREVEDLEKDFPDSDEIKAFVSVMAPFCPRP